MLPHHTTQHVHTHTQMAADKWGQTAAGMAISALILTGRNSKVLLFHCSPIHLLDSTHQTQPSLGSTLTEMASSHEDSHTRGKADTTLEALQLPPPRTSLSRNTHTTHMRAHTNCTHAHRHTPNTHTLTIFRHLSRSSGAPAMWSGGDNSLSSSLSSQYGPPQAGKQGGLSFYLSASKRVLVMHFLILPS